jgi:hypothetical protein
MHFADEDVCEPPYRVHGKEEGECEQPYRVHGKEEGECEEPGTQHTHPVCNIKNQKTGFLRRTVPEEDTLRKNRLTIRK